MAQFDLVRYETFDDASTNSKGVWNYVRTTSVFVTFEHERIFFAFLPSRIIVIKQTHSLKPRSKAQRYEVSQGIHSNFAMRII